MADSTKVIPVGRGWSYDQIPIWPEGGNSSGTLNHLTNYYIFLILSQTEHKTLYKII